MGASIVDASQGWLARLDEDPSELEAYLAAPSRRTLTSAGARSRACARSKTSPPSCCESSRRIELVDIESLSCAAASASGGWRQLADPAIVRGASSSTGAYRSAPEHPLAFAARVALKDEKTDKDNRCVNKKYPDLPQLNGVWETNPGASAWVLLSAVL